MPPKVADKLTDAEKKKVKQANKAKANPGKAEEKAKINLKRRITRGQIVDPTAIVADKKNKDTPLDTQQLESCSSSIVKPKLSDIEKAERLKLKMLAVEKELQEKQRLAQKERFEKLLQKPQEETPEETQ